MSKLKINKEYNRDNHVTLFNGDCINLLKEIEDESVDLVITSPPYCMKKAYENPKDDVDTFVEQHKKVFLDIYRVLKKGGSICWQVGYHVINSSVLPLDYLVYEIFTKNNEILQYPLILRNRIIWTFGHGLNASKRFSGRHEMILWFTKGDEYLFNLDSVRVPQKYPGKRAYKGPNKGKFSGNPLGKNPSDIWDIPNVKAQHIEKTAHPCQFPVSIPQRLIKALSPIRGVVLDPYMGSGSSGVAAVIEKRRFIGAEIQNEYYEISKERVSEAIQGTAKIRKDIPAMKPNLNTAVAKIPDNFLKVKEDI